MINRLDLYVLPAEHIFKVRRADGADGLRKRCDEFGEYLGEMAFAVDAGDFLQRLDDLLGVTLSDLLGSEIGDLDGTATVPLAGLVTETDIEDCVEALEQLLEAVELDPDDRDDDDPDLAPLFGLREQAEALAQDLSLALDSELVELLIELSDNLKAARDETGELIALVVIEPEP